MNDKITKNVLENSHKLVMYIASSILKENFDLNACILIDDSLYVSYKEHMKIILRFVVEEGYARERYFEIVSAKYITSINLKKHASLCFNK